MEGCFFIDIKLTAKIHSAIVLFMEKEEALSRIKQAKDAQDRTKIMLLSIDFDNYYLSNAMRLGTAVSANKFIQSVRPFMNVVHVWHSHRDREDFVPSNEYSEMVTISEEDDYSNIFPKTPPMPGDKVLCKRAFSPFTNTNLKEHIPRSDGITLVMGGARRYCIDTALEEGRAIGFNMAALTDLIYPGESLWSQFTKASIHGAPKLDSKEVLRTLSP